MRGNKLHSFLLWVKALQVDDKVLTEDVGDQYWENNIICPKLCILPTTTEAFRMNVLRAHLQLSHWYAALKTDPPHLDPLKFGFEADETNKVLNTVPLPAGVELAPDFVLKLIKYGYESSKPCKGGNCGCYNGQTPCTMFYACSGGEDCNNPFKKHVVEDESDSELGKQLRLF